MRRGTKKRGAILLLLAMVLSLIGVGPVGSKDALAANRIKLAKTKITVVAGKTKTVKIKNIKKKQVKKLTVKSKDSKLAKAKASKKTAVKVTGKKAGSTKVTVQLKLKKKVGGKKAYKFTLKVVVKKGDPTPTAKPTSTPTKLSTEIVTVDLSDATYYVGQNTGVSPLDASGTKVTPAEAATGGAVTYQWYMGPATGSAVAVATTAQYAPDITKAGTFSVYYTAKFTPTEQYKKTYQESSATSNKATITVLEKVPITFDANGGTFKNADKAKKEVKWGETLGTTPTASDMTAPTTGTGNKDFLGWATKSDAASSDVNSGTKITKAATFYAVWGTRPPDPPYTPPSAQTPQNVVITRNSADGTLTCSASVSDGGTLSYQWYSVYEPGAPATSLGTEASINQPLAFVDLTGRVYVVVTNSKQGCTSSSVQSDNYVLLAFDVDPSNNVTFADDTIGSESRRFVFAREGDPIVNPTAKNTAGTSPVTTTTWVMANDNTSRVTGWAAPGLSCRLNPVWQ